MLGSQDTALLHSVGDGKGLRVLAIILYSGMHVVVELAHHGDELGWASKLGHDLPEALPADGIERLCQVHEGGVESDILLLAFLL